MATDESITEAVRDITESSREAFEAGRRISEDLETLERRIQRATDWRARMEQNPLWIVGGAILGGVLLWRFFR
jgi:hypothetical protein